MFPLLTWLLAGFMISLPLIAVWHYQRRLANEKAAAQPMRILPWLLVSVLAGGAMILLALSLVPAHQRSTDTTLENRLRQQIDQAENAATRYSAQVAAGDRLLEEGHRRAAMSYYEDALQTGRRLEQAPVKQAHVLVRMSAAQTDNRASQAMLEEALRLQERHLPVEDPALATTLERLAWFDYPATQAEWLTRSSAQTARGVARMARAVAIRRHQPEDTLALARSLEQWAAFTLFQQPHQAADQLREALQLRQTQLGKNHSDVESAALQVADYYFIADDPAAVHTFLTDRYPTAAHKAPVATRLGWAAMLQAKPAEALTWFQQAHDQIGLSTDTDENPLQAIELALNLAVAHHSLAEAAAARRWVVHAEHHAARLIAGDSLAIMVDSMVTLPEPSEPPAPERQWTVRRWLYYRDILTTLVE